MVQTSSTPQTIGYFTGSLIAVLAVSATACSDDEFRFRGGARPSNVNVVFDPDVDFSQYRTFAVRDDGDAEASDPDDLDPATRRDLALVNALAAAELRDLGLIEVSEDEADLLAFSLGRTDTGRRVVWSCVGGAWGGYWYWGFYYYDPCAWVDADYVRVDRTTLVVGLIDPELSGVVFTGFIRDVGSRRGPRRRELARAVAEVFAQYPARPAGVDGGDGEPEPDAGAPDASTTPDGATPDGGTLDAGSLDAGTLDPGTLDAGSLP